MSRPVERQYPMINSSSDSYGRDFSETDFEKHNSDAESAESLLNNAEAEPGRTRLSKRTTKEMYSHTMCYLTLYLLILPIVFLGGIMAGRGEVWGPIGKDKICTKHTNSYSPVVKNVDIEWTTIPFNGSLLKPNEYRQPAGPDVDAAWEALGVDYHAVRIPDEDVEKSGLADHVRINPAHGGGAPANVEGLHQLHCLNLVRKALYYNFEHYQAMGKGPFANSEHILQLHVTHCLDIIRQQLMCQVDTGVLGQIWIDPQEPSAYVDFNTQHRCKNFDAVREWAKANQLPEKVPADFLLPPGPGDTIYSDIP